MTTDRPLGFSGNRLRRDGEGRDDATLAAAKSHGAAAFHLRAPDGWMEASNGGFAFSRNAADGFSPADETLLGFDADGRPAIAARVETAPDAAGDAAAAASLPPARALRSLAQSAALDPDTEGRLGQAEHFLNWHRRTRFCGTCGGETVAEAAGYRRRCQKCGEQHFPRTDPVAIMLVHDGAGNCLLGRGAHFAPGIWSCLAGFVEPGETLEDAVRREVFEESGIAVGAVSYHSSQPWPFPGSLMLGCTGLSTSASIRFDPAELEACRWFGRDEVRAMFAATHPDGLRLPEPFAIAHHLCRAFADGEVG